DLAFHHVFGEVRRQRRIWAEQAEEIHRHPRHSVLRRRSCGVQRRRGEPHGWLLPETHRVFPRRQRIADSRQVRPPALQQPHGSKEIEPVRPLGQFFHQRIWRIPILVGHRIISPRCLLRTTVSVNEFKETYFAKNSSSTPPRINTPVPSKAASSKVSVISRPRAKEIGPGAVTRRTTGLDLTVSKPSIWRRARRSFSSMYKVSNSRKPAAPSSPLAESTSVR